MYGNSLPGYDAWLERPFQDACDEAERYQVFCDERGFDPETAEAQEAYSDYIDSQWEAMEEYTFDDDLDDIDYDCWNYDPEDDIDQD